MTISSTTTVNQYTGNNSTTSFAYGFKIYADADLKVILTSTAGVETVQTLSTHYNVSGAGNAGGGNVTFTSGNTPGTGVLVTILRNTAITQSTDYVANDGFPAEAHEDALDRLTVIAQHQQDRIDRSIKAPDSEAAGYNMTLPAKSVRKGTVLGFNATSGNPEAGPTIADVSTLAAVTADIATLADIEDGTDATDAIQTAASNASNISTVAGISGNVTTVAGIASNVTSVAGNATNINTVAGDTADINALGAKTTQLGLLGTSDAIADMNTLGTSDVVSDMNTLGTSSNVTNMDTLAGISGNITTVAGVASNVTTVAGSISNVNTTASNISSVNTNATNISAIQGASANASTATTKASEAATSATAAASSATSAATAQTAAEAARDSALAAFDNFDDKYLGAKSSGPTVDNDGDALVAGALYFDTTAGAMQVYTGSQWVAAYASLSGALLVTNNLSDVNNAANAATNLNLGTGNTPTFNGVNTTGDISFGDSDKAKFGSSNDLSIFHDGSNSYVSDQGTGQLVLLTDSFRVNNAANSENIITAEENGAVSLFFNDSSKLATTSNGISVSGKATAEFIDVGGNDTGAAGLINVYGGATGEGGEIKIYPSAANDTTIDSFSIDIAGDSLRIFDSNGDMHAQFVPNSVAELYFNGSKKFETSANGIKTSTDGSSSAQLDIASGSTWSIRSNPTSGTNSYGLDFIKGSAGTDVKMVLNSSGKLGVGTSNPIADFSLVDSSTGSGMEFQPEVTTDTNRLTNYDRGDSSYKKFRLDASEQQFYTSGSEKMRIGATGEIQIGGTSNAGFIDFDSTNLQFNTQRNPNTGAFVNTGKAHANITLTGDNGSSHIAFKTASANNTTASERMRVTTTGLGVGTTSPTHEFHVNSGVTNVVAKFESTDGYAGIQLKDNTGSAELYAVGNNMAFFPGASAEEMRLTSGGDLHVDGNVIAYSTTISDERLKENIKPIEGALDKIGQINGYTFTYKDDGKESAGVIAQEVEAVLPSAVTESTLPLKTDDDVEYKTVQYDQLHGLLIEAIKELKAEIEELKNGSAK